jgi:hypothetical protein
VGTLLSATPPPARPLDSVYLDGEVVRLDIADGLKPEAVGPWRIGARVVDPKPRDKRLNLYIVAPGTQYHAESADEFDHNALVNALPEPQKSREYDVYWALVLDPHLRLDFKSEQQLLVATQSEFTPSDLFEFDDIPADGFLHAFLRMDALDDLAQFRRKDRRLPRLVIVPAGFAVMATNPAQPEPAK